MNKKDIIQKILDNMKALTLQEEVNKKAALYKALMNQEFATLDNQVRDLTSQMLNAKYGTKGYKELATNLSKKTIERDKVFESFYTTPCDKTICPLCKNEGRLNNKFCSCINKKLKEELLTQNGFKDVPNNFGNKTLSFFAKDKIQHERFRDIYAELHNYCASFPKDKKPNRVLMGSPGTGKTFATMVITNFLLSEGHYVIHVTSDELIKKFREFVFDHNEDARNDLTDCDLLIIDDLGTEPTIPNVTEENLFAVINRRLNDGKPFIISTNLTTEQLNKKYDSRILSRILAKNTTAIINFGSRDMRF